MLRTALVAAAVGGLVTSASFGAFTFAVGAPNTTLIPGKKIIQLYALNNGDTGGINTGTLLKAFAPVFSATGGGLYINADNSGTPGDPSDDSIDFPNAAGVNPTLTSAGNGFSYVRIGSAAQTLQIQAIPSSADPYVIGNAGTGIPTASVTIATTANVNASSTVNGGLGFRTAVLVLNANVATLTLTGQIGGDIGPAQTIAPQTFAFVPEPTAAVALFGVAGLGIRRRRGKAVSL